jgi:hypothetical protein
MFSKFPLCGLALGVALLVCSPSWAESTTDTNQQSVAPAGGTSVQKGDATTPAPCPDDQARGKDGKCPLVAPAAQPASDSTGSMTSTKQPAMK